LVGIIDADQSMYFSDYRSLERTFQLITQVAGRAGRDKLPGKVVLQTYSPRHYILNFATHYNYKGFFDYEISVRQATAFPPFATVLRIMIVSEVEQKAKMCARTLYNKVLDLKKKEEDAFAYLNGMKSPIKKIENKFRFQIIARIVGEKQEEIIQSLYKIVDENKLVGVHSYLEVNPTNVY
ncbi:MAG: primosomal protein N', partial [Clostridia bacterium]|nr:primosomal protein N' [Clostridia bacterium]